MHAPGSAAGRVGAVFVVMAALAALGGGRAAAQPEPTGPHPRIVLDDALRATWKKQAKQKGSAVARAIGQCKDAIAEPDEANRDTYMGLDWAGILQACLVAHAATGDAAYARTAIVYFTALLDDEKQVGDGQGGDRSVERDAGYAIRSIGPYTALAYDWLHDAPGMTPKLREHARARWKAWTDWYLAKGYRARYPGNNYHAGYLASVTLIAIAQGGEAGATGTALWRLVVDELWQKDMVTALKPGGVLDGGDWGEGWQYGPLSVSSYALAARALAGNGVTVDGFDRWLSALVRRHVHAATPSGDRTFVGGDTDDDHAHLDISALSLTAVALGDAPAEDQAWALAEIKRLKLVALKSFPLYDALAEGRVDKATEVPRTSWPTWYLAPGISQLYARSGWGRDAVWMAARCSRDLDVDHMPPDAGNVVLSRGKDDLIVDPSPYGSLSTLTGNAPTVESAHLLPEYKPSQAFWSVDTGWRWAHQTTRGVVVARCDYADQYRFQERASDVPLARRDFILVPRNQGRDATLIVLDDAETGDPARGLHLRFRTPGLLKLDGGIARGRVNDSQLVIRGLAAGKPEIRKVPIGDCYKGSPRGACETARIPVMELRTVVPGPTMRAIHVIDAVGSSPGELPAEALTGKGGAGVVVRRGPEVTVVVEGTDRDHLSYTAPPGLHVIVSGPGKRTGVVRSTGGKGSCDVSLVADGAGTTATYPMVLTLDDRCAISEDPVLRGGLGTDVTALKASEGGIDRGPRAGCCSAQSSRLPPAAPIILVVLGLLWLYRPRRRL